MLLTFNRTPNSTTIEVTQSLTRSVYKYNSGNLLWSYSVAVCITILALLLGFYSFLNNGVTHSTDFSAILATTRNPALDEVSRGYSLGTLPMDKSVKGIRLRFGELKEENNTFVDENGQKVKHIGFGLENEVSGLKRYQKYVWALPTKYWRWKDNWQLSLILTLVSRQLMNESGFVVLYSSIRISVSSIVFVHIVIRQNEKSICIQSLDFPSMNNTIPAKKKVPLPIASLCTEHIFTVTKHYLFPPNLLLSWSRRSGLGNWLLVCELHKNGRPSLISALTKKGNSTSLLATS